MTREEAYNRIDAIIAKYEIDDEYVTITNLKDYEALRMARKILEQEPCEDAISRITVQEEISKSIALNENPHQLWKRIQDLPLVTPVVKTGKWIENITDMWKAEDGCDELYSYWACSECGRSVGFNLANIEDVLNDYPYCHCGAKMVEPQESEGQE